MFNIKKWKDGSEININNATVRDTRVPATLDLNKTFSWMTYKACPLDQSLMALLP
jgi:hypothetical protein